MKKSSYFPFVLETHLVDHCNLRCKGCSHFAPLVKGEAFADIGIFRRDMERMRLLFDDIFEIRLMGGEPLLHPELLSFFDVVRKSFPKSRVSMFTNGIGLLNMPDTFWEKCADRQILVKLTHYPVQLPIDEIKRKAKKMQVQIKIPNRVRYFFKHLNISGDSDPESSFRNCRLMFQTPQLRDGKLYPCFFPAYVHIFSSHFDLPISASDKDFVNILENDDPSGILKFLDQQIPMCRWCLEKREFVKWDLSRRDIHEWIGNNAGAVPHFFRGLKYHAIRFYNESKRRLHR